MIRDPSDGSVRDPPVAGKFPSTEMAGNNPVIDTSTSGLPITKAKAEYLARLEESRKWLKSYSTEKQER